MTSNGFINKCYSFRAYSNFIMWSYYFTNTASFFILTSLIPISLSLFFNILAVADGSSDKTSKSGIDEIFFLRNFFKSFKYNLLAKAPKNTQP